MVWEEGFWANNGYEVLLKQMRAGSESSKSAAKLLHEKAIIDSDYSKSLAKLSKSVAAVAKDDYGSMKVFWDNLRAEIDNQAKLIQAVAQNIENEIVKSIDTFREEQLKARANLDKKYLAAEKSYAAARANEQKARKNSFAYAKILETAADVHSRATERDAPKAEKNVQKAKKDSEMADKEFKASVRKVRATKLTWEETFLTCCLEYEIQESQRIINLKQQLEKFSQAYTILYPQLIESYQKVETDLQNINEQGDLQTVLETKQTGSQRPEDVLYTTYAFDSRNQMNPQRRGEALAQAMAEIDQELASENKGLAGVENLLKVYKDQPSFANNTTRVTSEHQLNSIKDYIAKLLALQTQYDEALTASGGVRSSFVARPASPISSTFDDRGYDDTPYAARASVAPPRVGGKCRALYDFIGTNEGELTVHEGDILKIVAMDDPEWWTVELNAEQGFVPNTYVEVI